MPTTRELHHRDMHGVIIPHSVNPGPQIECPRCGLLRSGSDFEGAHPACRTCRSVTSGATATERDSATTAATICPLPSLYVLHVGGGTARCRESRHLWTRDEILSHVGRDEVHRLDADIAAGGTPDGITRASPNTYGYGTAYGLPVRTWRVRLPTAQAVVDELRRRYPDGPPAR